MKQKQAINDTESIRIKELNKLPKEKYHGFFLDMINTFKDLLSKKITDVIRCATKIAIEKLTKEFTHYVEHVDFNSAFSSDCQQCCVKEIQE